MNLITTSTELKGTFRKLMNRHSAYLWMVAWAGIESEMFDLLKQKQSRIEKIIVGLHFYQTHPDFIGTFLNHNNVRFIKQPHGTFHPKMYLFYSDETSWDIIVGSPNFTSPGFSKNMEITLHVSSNDDGADQVLKESRIVIDTCWKNSELFDKEELEDYRKAWKNHRPKLDILAGHFGFENIRNQHNTPLFKVPIASLSWEDFLLNVIDDPYHGVEARLKVLEICRGLFLKIESFSELEIDERKFIAGIPHRLPVDLDVDNRYFGSMMGAGKFKKRIAENDKYISTALDCIPLSGQITKNQYERFSNIFSSAFSDNSLAIATRLLAMKRPDVFICVDKQNKEKLCEAFEIRPNWLNLSRYWDIVVERIYLCDWWLNPNPKDELGRKVSEARAAFLDVLYYVEK